MNKKTPASDTTPAMAATEWHMGQFLHDFLKKHRLSKAALSRAMGIGDVQMNRLLGRKDVKVSVLLGFSHVYQHNFFADLAATLPAHYVHAQPDTSLQDRITALEAQLKLVAAERDVLKEVVKGRMG